MTEPTTRPAEAAPAWIGAAPAIFVFLWATGFIGSRLSAPYAEPLSFLTIRFAVAAAVLIAVGFAMGARWPDRRTALHAMVVGALVHGGYLAGVFWSIWKGMPAAVAALIVGLQPLATALLAGLLIGERVTVRHWLGLAAGLAGIGLVVAPHLSFAAAGITPATVAACVLAMLSITLGSIYQKAFTPRADLRTANAWQFVGAAAVVLLGALAGESFAITWNPDTVFAMAWMVLVLSIGAISLLYVMIRHADVSRVAALFYLVPAITAVIAWAMFGETLSPVQLAGMALCAGAVMVAGRR